MKSQLTLVAAVFFGAMGGSFLTRIIEPAEAFGSDVKPHCHALSKGEGMTRADTWPQSNRLCRF